MTAKKVEPSVEPVVEAAPAAPAVESAESVTADVAPAYAPATIPASGGAPSFLSGGSASRTVALTLAAVLVVLGALAIGFVLGNRSGVAPMGRVGGYEMGEVQSEGSISVYPAPVEGTQGCPTGDCGVAPNGTAPQGGTIPNPSCPSGGCEAPAQ